MPCSFVSYGGEGLDLLTPSPPGPLNDDALAVVEGVLADAKTFATDAETRALAAVEALSQFNVDLPLINAPDIPIPTLELPQLGEAPQAPDDLTPAFPLAPDAPTLGDLGALDLGAPPDLSATAPLLADIALPVPLAASLPAVPALTEVDVPAAPDTVLPQVPTLLGLNLPAAPSLNLPSFSATLGDAPLAPDVTFAWGEANYATSLLARMNERLLALVSGMSTGLDPDVEQAIWDRSRERERANAQRGIADIRDGYAARGYLLPPGAMQIALQRATEDAITKDSSLSREVMIKQAELEQSNFQFAFSRAIDLETQLISLFNNVQNRALDAAKYEVQAAVDVFEARVSLYNADVNAFRARADVFKTQLEGELARLEIYKTELEAQRLIGQLNQQSVEVYRAQLQGVQTVVDIYRTRVAAAQAIAEMQRVKIAAYGEQVRAYGEQVRAKAVEYEGYSTQVRAQATRVEMFGTQVQAYGRQVDAYGTLVKAKLDEQTLEFKRLQEFPLEVYKARLEAFRTSVQAETERIKGLVDIFGSRVQAYGEGERAKAAISGAGADVVKAQADAYAQQARVSIEAADNNLRALQTAHETVQTSLRAAGQIAGQLAAAALAARNVHASIQSSSSSSASSNVSRSASLSENRSRSTSCTDIYSHSD